MTHLLTFLKKIIVLPSSYQYVNIADLLLGYNEGPLSLSYFNLTAYLVSKWIKWLEVKVNVDSAVEYQFHPFFPNSQS